MKPLSNGLVSTIIPVYNRAALLSKAVESVLAQTYRPIEIIIVDDGSTDDTAEIAQELALAHPTEVRALHLPNGGAGRAREAGRLVAQGEFIQYLDSDDLLLQDKFAVQVAALRAHPECGIAYGISRLIDEDGAVLRTPYKWTARRYDTLFPALLVDRWWSTNTPLYRREVSDAVGPWSNMRMSEDWEYESRVGALGVKLIHCPQPLSDSRQHAQSRLTGHRDPLVHCSDMVRLIPALYTAALQAGVATDCAEMKHFARWAFLEARRAGAAGLAAGSQECFRVARQSGAGRFGAQLNLYRLAASILGWKRAGHLSIFFERLLRSRRAGDSLPMSWSGS